MRAAFSAACRCDTGRVRKNNEDNFYFDGQSLPEIHCGTGGVLTVPARVPERDAVFAVFDGMGGEDFGEAASCRAAECLAELLQTAPAVSEQQMRTAAERCNEAVLREARARGTAHMGSTMAALALGEESVTLCNLGDSRIYRLRNGALRRLSADQTLKDPLYPHGKAPLTQHLGLFPEERPLRPQVRTLPVQAGDTYLLCSDGITDMLPEECLRELLAEKKNAAETVNALVDAALERGGADNATAIVIRAGEGAACGKRKRLPAAAAALIGAAVLLALLLRLLFFGGSAKTLTSEEPGTERGITEFWEEGLQWESNM